MININKNTQVTGKIVNILNYTSMTVYQVETKKGMLEYTVFGQADESLCIGACLCCVVGYSVTLNNYTIRYIERNLKVA